MTKKDYVLIAAALKTTRPSGPDTDLLRAQWIDDVATLAVKLGEQNARFDHDRFLAACGTK